MLRGSSFLQRLMRTNPGQLVQEAVWEIVRYDEEISQPFAVINAVKAKIFGCNGLHQDCRTVNMTSTVMSECIDSRKKDKKKERKT